MAVGACPDIHQVGRVGDDQVKAARNGVKQVALGKADTLKRCQQSVGAGMLQGERIDICQHQFRSSGLRRQGSCNAARTGTAAHVENARATGQRGKGQFVADQRRKAVTVGPEKNRVRAVGRKGGMCIQLVIKRRKTNPAAKQLAAMIEQVGLGQPAQCCGRQQLCFKRPGPAKDIAQIPRRRGMRPRIHARMRCRGGCDKAVAHVLKPAAQQDEQVRQAGGHERWGIDKLKCGRPGAPPAWVLQLRRCRRQP